MQAPEIVGPPLAKMPGNWTFDFPHQPSTRNSHLSSWLHKSSEVIQIQVVRPVVWEGINAHDRVEEFDGEWQRPGIGVNREHPILDAGIPDSLGVFRRAEP